MRLAALLVVGLVALSGCNAIDGASSDDPVQAQSDGQSSASDGECTLADVSSATTLLPEPSGWTLHDSSRVVWGSQPGIGGYESMKGVYEGLAGSRYRLEIAPLPNSSVAETLASDTLDNPTLAVSNRDGETFSYEDAVVATDGSTYFVVYGPDASVRDRSVDLLESVSCLDASDVRTPT